MQNEELSQKKKKYDTVCKKVLSRKPVLAKILKSCVDEYKDYDMKFIEEQCIEGDTISFSMGVNPDESYPHIIGDDTVDKLEREGTEYCFCEKNVLGYYRGNKEKYDLIDIIIIGLGGLEKKDDETIIGFLDNILDRDLEPLMRRKILKEKFDITTDEDFMEVFDDMCNLSDGVYLDGVEKGIIQGKAEGIEKGIKQGKAEGIIQGKAEGLAQGRLELIKNSFNKFKSFDECINFFNITDKNEIKFLRENL